MTGRSLPSLGLLLAMLAGLAQARPAWMHDLGVDWWELPELRRQMDREQERGQQIDAYGEVVLARVRYKEAVVGALLAGRLGLAQAAACFRAIDERLPQGREVAGAPQGRMAAGERACREVLGWFQGRHPKGLHGDAEVLLSRLSAELAEELRNRADVPLPAVEWIPSSAAALKVAGGPEVPLTDAGGPAVGP